MTDTPAAPPRRSRPPLWLVEGLDVVEQRRPVLIAVTVGVIALGGILAVVAPGLVPPVPLVGAAVGLAALLLGLAVAVALDAADLRLRGPRHVGAAGGELVAVLPTVAEPTGAAILADAVLEARAPGAPLLLGLAASGRDVRPTVAWTDALATALEAEGVSVLRIDLASGHSRSAGLLEVVRDGVQLASAVTFVPEARLARLGAGEDLNGALAALSSLPGRLPRDLDVLLVALPMAASQPVVTAVRSLDHVLIVAQRDRTSRVELIAGLDALEAAGTRAQVALLDDRTAARLASPSPPPSPPTPEPEVPDEVGPAPVAASEAERGEAAATDAAEVRPDAEVPPADRAEATDAGDVGTDTDAEVPPADRVGADTPAEPSATDDLDEEPGADQSGAAPGPRSEGALGVGGAALTAAGIAAAVEAGRAEAEVGTAHGDEPPEAASLEAASPDARSPEAASPDARSPEAEILDARIQEASGGAGTAHDVDAGAPAPAGDVEDTGGARDANGAADAGDAVSTAPTTARSVVGARSGGGSVLGPADEQAPSDREANGERANWLSWDDTPREHASPPIVGGEGPGPDPTATEHPRPAALQELEDSGQSDDRPDPGQSERRDVDVVHGAAEAAAIALAELPVEPLLAGYGDTIGQDGALPVGGDAVVAVAAPDLPPAAVQLQVAAATIDSAAAAPSATSVPTAPPVTADQESSVHDDGDADHTDETPVAGARNAISDGDEGHDELLQTTAQLSMVRDDQDVGGGEEPRDTP